MRRRLTALRAAATSREPAQIMVLFAVFVVVLLVLAGSAYDYASIVVDDAELQNAVDAAALAGSDSLSRNAILGAVASSAAASGTATEYLRINGVATSATTNINITYPTSTPVAGIPTPVVPPAVNISIKATRSHATAFWPLVGVNQVNMSGSGSAHAANGMIDVMLSLDTTNSMAAEFPALQAAVVDFVNAMNPQTSDPRSPRIGLARWQGESCSYRASPTPNYYNCTSDYTQLSSPSLMSDADDLRQLAAGPVSGCPGLTAYACPIHFHSPGSGTKLPNGIKAVDGTGTTPYAWTSANGARNDIPAGSGWAKKILIMMTDGEDNDQYDSGSPSRASMNGQWDLDVVNAATVLQNGASAVDPSDDVEIYVINFQCDATNTYPSGCTSKLASTAIGAHLCPGTGAPNSLPGTTSNTDNVLIAVSSSKPTTCDHYFPLRKDEDLPSLFIQLAGTISRGALTD
jgi:Flp pilus assembly protein TadG